MGPVYFSTTHSFNALLCNIAKGRNFQFSTAGVFRDCKTVVVLAFKGYIKNKGYLKPKRKEMAYYYSSQGGGGGGAGYKSTGGYYDQQDVTVAVPSNVTVTSEREPWSWCATVWASLALFCCPYCLLCNFISLLCLGHSYTDHKSGDQARRHYKWKCGVGWLVTSWVLGVITLVVLIVVPVLAYQGAIDLSDVMAYYYSNQGGGGGYKGDTRGEPRYYDDTNLAMPAQGVTVSTQRRPWNWCATVWASIAFFICPWCILCNFISLMCLSHAYSDHKTGDDAREKYKRNCGVGWLVTAWVLGIIFIVVIITLSVLVQQGTVDLSIYCYVLGAFQGYC